MTGTPDVDYVVLLRGINVGGRSQLAMAALRDELSAAGFERVATYVNSGNVVVAASRPDADADSLAAEVEAVISAGFGRHVPVVARAGADFTKVVQGNPYAQALATGTPPKNVSVAFGRAGGAEAPTDLRSVLARLDLAGFAPEHAHANPAEVYLLLPFGTAESKLLPALTKLCPVPLTVRNWNTVARLGEMLARR